MPARLWSLIRLGRPLFLLGGVVLNGLGVAMARWSGFPIDVAALLLGQVTITASQLMTHFSNEYFDLPADRANPTPTAWAGGSRVLTDGALAPRTALVAALISAAVAVTGALVLGVVVRPEPSTFVLVGSALALAWGYSSPPLRLHGRGLGEVVGAVLIAGLTPLVGYVIQVGHVDAWAVATVAPLCALQFVMLVAVSLPDAVGDAAVGKRTLAVRFGRRRTARLAAAVLAGAYALGLPLALRAGMPEVAGMAYLAWLPLAIWQAWRLATRVSESGGPWDSLSFWSIGLVVGSAATVALGLWWAG
jgi:1,4-dihydroxy-2-naphthoate octaprenyltransferase